MADTGPRVRLDEIKARAEKACTKCEGVKPLDEFHRSKTGSDGRKSQCKTCARASANAWDAENRERNKAAAREYRNANRDSVLQYHRNRRKASPHVAWEEGYKRRAVEYGFEPVIESFTRDELIAKYGDQCYHCGGSFEELDHLRPVRFGGHHTLENCVPSCQPCNRPDTNAGIYAATRVLPSHCIRGHEFNEANTYKNAGKRYCRECRRKRNAGSLLTDALDGDRG